MERNDVVRTPDGLLAAVEVEDEDAITVKIAHSETLVRYPKRDYVATAAEPAGAAAEQDAGTLRESARVSFELRLRGASPDPMPPLPALTEEG